MGEAPIGAMASTVSPTRRADVAQVENAAIDALDPDTERTVDRAADGITATDLDPIDLAAEGQVLAVLESEFGIGTLSVTSTDDDVSRSISVTVSG